MKEFKFCYIFDNWDIRTKVVKAASLQVAKKKLKTATKGKASSITIA